MTIRIYLPKETGFDIEIDNEYFYSKAENTTKTISLKEGSHILSLTDQVKIPKFLQKLITFLNPMYSERCLNKEINFDLLCDMELKIAVIYGDFEDVSVELDDEVLPFVEYKNE